MGLVMARKRMIRETKSVLRDRIMELESEVRAIMDELDLAKRELNRANSDKYHILNALAGVTEVELQG